MILQIKQIFVAYEYMRNVTINPIKSTHLVILGLISLSNIYEVSRLASLMAS